MNEEIISLAREIGRRIQEDEYYKNLESARIASDEDEELQRLIGEFNLKRIAINEEGMKKDKDQTKIQSFNNEMRVIYSSIMENENMLAYNDAKVKLDNLVGRINAIITQSAQGENPYTTDVRRGCSGDCSGCNSCN